MVLGVGQHGGHVVGRRHAVQRCGEGLGGAVLLISGRVAGRRGVGAA
ncbi:hypothetical protein [Lichenibacterium dinghuense]|nr:hypothetical protein [Lichenibacterium sp. 6Y81]